MPRGYVWEEPSGNCTMRSRLSVVDLLDGMSAEPDTKGVTRQTSQFTENQIRDIRWQAPRVSAFAPLMVPIVVAGDASCSPSDTRRAPTS